MQSRQLNLSNPTANESNGAAEQIKSELVASLFTRVKTSVIGHMLIIACYSLWLSSAVSVDLLINWIIVSVAVCAVHFSICLSHQSQARSKLSEQKWLQLWMLSSAFIALSYVYGATVLSANLGLEYSIAGVALIFVVIGFATIFYAKSLRAVSSFALPLCALSAMYFMVYGAGVEVYFGAAIVVYTTMCFVAIRQTNKSLVKAIELRHQHKQETDKLKLLERQLYDISRRDPLTGLFNRRYFDEMLEVELGRAYRNHTSVSLVLLDVDYFSEYNEQYGHEAGDNCLVNIAHLLENETNRKGDLVARYSGAEFAFILPGIDAKGTVAFATRLQTLVQNKRIEHKSTKLTSLKSITVSVGVTSVLPLMKMKPNQLIDQADKALFDAKKDGRNRVKAFSPFGIDHQDMS